MNKVYIIDKTTNITYYLVGIKEISPNSSTTITEYPVPEGGRISDHSYKNPNSLSIQMISDGFDALKKSYYIDQEGNIVNLSYSALKDLLENWIENAVQLEIQTVHKLFHNMLLNNVSWREGEGSWSKFTPTMAFKEARIAKVYTTTINALNVSTGANYSVEEETGESNGTEMNSQSVVGGVLAGAAVGALVGGIIPGVGHVAGAVVGGVIGFFSEIF